ncbi:MAG: DNA repair exonuclease [Isosphaeraceae bacterium]
MPIRFLHAADIHLDSPFRGLERYDGAPVDRIRGATRKAFDRLVDLAIDRRADFAIISGDLYDGDWRDYNTGLYLASRLNRLRDAGIPVVLIKGNHDAHNKMTRSLRLPNNAIWLDHDRPQTVRFDHLNVAVHGQSFASRDVSDNLAKAYPKPVGGWTNIGLLHTALTGKEGHEPYAPCTLDDLRASEYDYWALGHIHARETLNREPFIAFPGNLQGRHARETGPKGCLIVEVDRGTIRERFHRLDAVRWERVRVDLNDVARDDDLWGLIASRFDELLRDDPDPDRLLAARLILHGVTPIDDRIRTQADRYVAEARGLATERGDGRIWVEKVELQTRPYRASAVADGPMRVLEELLGEFRDDPTELIAELEGLRKKLPGEFTAEPDGIPLHDPDCLRSLLEGVGPVLRDLLRRAQAETAGSASADPAASKGIDS